MRVRRWSTLLTSVGLLLLGAAPPAHASTRVAHNWWDFHGHSCLSQSCWVSWYAVSAYSDPRFGDCAGTDGAYTSCRFHVSCQSEGWGVAGYDVACGSAPVDACDVTVEVEDEPLSYFPVPLDDCRAEVHTTVDVAAGACAYVPTRVTARSFADHLPMEYAMRLCANGSGPYLVTVPYDEPAGVVRVAP